MSHRWSGLVPGLISLVLVAAALEGGCGGSSGSGGEGGQGKGGSHAGGSGGGTQTITEVPTACLNGTICAADSDCPMGTRCNEALDKPECETIYCGALGTLCSARENCDKSLVCDDAHCCAGESEACVTDADCCPHDFDGSRLPATCVQGLCVVTMPACDDSEIECFDDTDCCEGNVCDIEAGVCNPANPSCQTCAEAFNTVDLGAVAPCLGDDQRFAAIRDCECNEFGDCAVVCAAGCNSMPREAACDECLAANCAEELSACGL